MWELGGMGWLRVFHVHCALNLESDDTTSFTLKRFVSYIIES